METLFRLVNVGEEFRRGWLDDAVFPATYRKVSEGHAVNVKDPREYRTPFLPDDRVRVFG
jgi:hypothetical protein